MTDKKEEFKVSGEDIIEKIKEVIKEGNCLLYTSPSPRDRS